MARAIVDPDELRRFSGQLKQTSEQLRSAKANIMSEFDNLHETWRDEKFERFDRLFIECLTLLDRYTKEAELYSDFLRKKAEYAQRYLDNR